MTLRQRKMAFKSLGEYLRTPDQKLLDLINTAHHFNAWFTPEETKKALNGIANMLNEHDLDLWFGSIDETDSIAPKTIGLVLAGNIPIVGFHDILSVLATGHTALIKASSQDSQLLPYLMEVLIRIEQEFKERILFTDRLERFEAVIATGSDNTSRYFEHYFGKVPNIIRKNRNSIAVINGNETETQLSLLGKDLFDYYGLGCRNVSKVFVPTGYDFRIFFESIESYKNVVNHNKYCNNYEYNKSIYLINRDKHLDNGFLLVKEDTRLASPLAVLYYEEYDSKLSLEEKVNSITERVQCIVSDGNLKVSNQQVGFGETQQPKLWDYADGINTMEFLVSL